MGILVTAWSWLKLRGIWLLAGLVVLLAALVWRGRLRNRALQVMVETQRAMREASTRRRARDRALDHADMSGAAAAAERHAVEDAASDREARKAIDAHERRLLEASVRGRLGDVDDEVNAYLDESEP